MFIEPVPLAILAITHLSVTAEVPSSLSPTGETLSPTSETLSPTSHHTEISSETTSKTTSEITTTTPYPSSSNERPAETDSARSGGGVQDETPKDPASDHGTATLEPNEEKPVARGEALDEQRPALTFPAKLTEAEYEDIAAQVYPLPPKVAQQMLDVIESKIKAGQIKTSAAAVLRGIVRKYRVEPEAFDPSSGFQIAEVRRRRAETAARLEAARQESIRQREEVTPRTLSEIGRASLASMLNTLRGGVNRPER